MRLGSLFGFLLLSAAGLMPTPSLAGPFAGAAPCGPDAVRGCPSEGRRLAEPVDWFDDLFGIELPPGSWRDSCRKARVEGHFLTAECRRKSGSYRDVTFDLRRCSGDIGNDNGKLFCERERRGEQNQDKTTQPPFAGKD
jgi:hypothetical protein